MSTGRSESEWFASWFGEEYLALYSHRDQAEARHQVAFAKPFLPPSGALLDIACGAGRHLRELLALRPSSYGIDLSHALLRSAVKLPVLRADMRALPFRSDSFTAITNFFTSFGYFEGDEAHIHLLQEWRRVLRGDGVLFLDYLNAPAVIKNLIPLSVDSIGKSTVTSRREYHPHTRRLVKTIEISSPKESSPRHFTERVTLYERERLLELLKEAGFTPRHCFGSFSGDPHTEDSPRVIVVAS